METAAVGTRQRLLVQVLLVALDFGGFLAGLGFLAGRSFLASGSRHDESYSKWKKRRSER